jgi:prepilin-type processing-associated H-X9-DG protein
LVELLVVIAIIGVLTSMTFIGIGYVMESARRNQCLNNLKQMGYAIELHVGAHTSFPTGGWGFRWAGDPERGFDSKQPGGWTYNLLPYLGESRLRDQGMRLRPADKRAAGKRQAETPVAVFICPSRRASIAYPYVRTDSYFNIDPPQACGRCDYAANSGDRGGDEEIAGPPTLVDGDNAKDQRSDRKVAVDDNRFVWPRIANEATGLIYLRSMVWQQLVSDGLSRTYLLGEKYLQPSQYDTGTSHGDDQGWDVGFDMDINRFTQNAIELAPRQDSDQNDNPLGFGSAHPHTMNFLFADGSVKSINYLIDALTHAQLGNRSDGKPIDEVP